LTSEPDLCITCSMSVLPKQSFFDSGSVVWELQGTDKYSAIREIIYRAPIFRSVPNLDLNAFAEKVIDRENIQSTGFGHGVAVAHGRTPEVNASHIALGVSRDGIEYDSFDGEPVHLLFIVANHPDQQMDYLQILSTLISLVRDERFRNELLSCMCQEELEQKMCNAFGNLLSKSHQRAQRCSPHSIV